MKFTKRLKKNIIRESGVVANRFRRKWYLTMWPQANIGTARWLAQREINYGGFVTNVKRDKVSDKDPRKKEEIVTGGMTGGDRMYNHLYASKYSKYLKQYFKGTKQIALAEVGILKGSGLAIWCDLFPEGRIMGFDIDLSHTKNNMEFLVSKGAFKQNKPELFEFDQYNDNIELLRPIVNGEKIDIVIDDGFHSETTILNTFKSFQPYLAENFVYIVEDNEEVVNVIKKIYPHYQYDYANRLTVIT